MINLYMTLAAAVGAGLAAQAGINAQLRLASGSALWASIISAGITVALLGSAQVIARDPLQTTGLLRAPWWIWMGGLMGAAYVFGIVALTRYLGVALLFAAIVVGQLLTGLLIDHNGWFGVPVQRISVTRFLGAVLLVAGMLLVRWR